MTTQTLILHLDCDPLGDMVVVELETENPAHPTVDAALAAAGLDPTTGVRSVEVYEPIAA